VRRRALLLLLGALLAACPEEEKPPPSAGFRIDSPPPSRPALAVPESEPTAEEKISFSIGLLGRGAEDDVGWALAQLNAAGDAAAGPLARRLEAVFGQPAMEHLARGFAEAVRPVGATEVLVRAAAVRDERVGLYAVRALGRGGDPAAMPVLLDLLGSGLSAVGTAALEGVFTLGGDAALNGILGRFPDRMDAGVAARAITAIADRLPDDRRAVFLRGALASEDARIALSAARQALRRTPELSTAARGRLDGFLEGDFRGPALEVLAEARDPAALVYLRQVCEVADDGPAIFAIGNLSHYDAPEARATLWKVAASAHEARRREALHALVRSGDPKALPHIRGMLSSASTEDRLVASLVLGSVRDPGSRPQLQAATEVEPVPAVRIKLANALALLGAPEGSGTVARLLLSETGTEPSTAFMANQAASMLLRFPEISPEARDLIGVAMRSGNEAIRMNGARAAGRPGLGTAMTALLAGLLRDESVHVRRSATASYVLADDATAGPLAEAYRREGDGRLAKDMEKGVQKLLHRWRSF
jgi:HEAT repeat protein